MKKAASLLTRHRSLFLIVLLTATLAASSAANQRRLSEGRQTTPLPVMRTDAGESVEVFSAGQTDAYLAEIAALQALVQQEQLDQRTREDAAARLTALIADHEAASALETALASTSLAPCAAIVTGDTVTLLTHSADFSDADAALLVTLAAAHASADPSNVRIMSVE